VGGAYSAPQTPSWFLGICFAAGEGREGKGRGRREGKGRGAFPTSPLFFTI